MAGAGLRLEVTDYGGPTEWRWTLTDEAGVFEEDHEVRLDRASWEYEAFSDLLGYLSWHVAPDRRRADEARIVGEVGAWIGTQVLGPVAAALARLARPRPVTVRVVPDLQPQSRPCHRSASLLPRGRNPARPSQRVPPQ